MSNTVLVTGAAGFIGSHVTQALLARGDRVVALDNFNDYYNPQYKRQNVEEVRQSAPDPSRLTLLDGDLRERSLLVPLFSENRFDTVIHLAAMAGVRASVERPALYCDVNVSGTLALIEAAHAAGVERFVSASTSSVYGDTDRIPFVEDDACVHPLSPYAATKRAAELLGYTYHHVHGFNFTALRFFTVYGPRNRPDMMAYKLMDSIFHGREVPLYNGGQMHRDWTYVGDIVAGVVAAGDTPLGFEVINLGRGEPVLLADFVRIIEDLTGRKATLVDAPAPDTDMQKTYADVSKARGLLGYDPQVSVAEGLERFWKWYRAHRLG